MLTSFISVVTGNAMCRFCTSCEKLSSELLLFMKLQVSVTVSRDVYFFCQKCEPALPIDYNSYLHIIYQQTNRSCSMTQVEVMTT
jgi:hypothetical protein